MKKCNFLIFLAVCLAIILFVSETQSSAAVVYIRTSSVSKEGKVTNITKSKVVYRTQLGSDPISWAKPKTLKIVSSTKFYKCLGYNSSFTKYKVRTIKKSKAIKAIYNNRGNYVFFITNGNKIKKLIYGMENFVG